MNLQRVVEDLQARNQHDLGQVQSRLQQEVEAHTRDVAHFQNQVSYQRVLLGIVGLSFDDECLYCAWVNVFVSCLQLQLQVTHSQNLQSAMDQIEQQRQQGNMALHEAQAQLAAAQQQQQQSSQPDAAVTAELEELKQAKSRQEEEAGAARDKLAKEQERFAKDLSEMKRKLDDTDKELKKARQGGDSARQEMETKLTEMTKRMAQTESESARLAEENERLSAELASNVERPKAEGQESVNGGSKQNGSVENGIAEEVWEKKYQLAVQEKEERESAVSRLQGEVDTFSKQLGDVQKQLEEQKAKNNVSTTVLSPFKLTKRRGCLEFNMGTHSSKKIMGINTTQFYRGSRTH